MTVHIMRDILKQLRLERRIAIVLMALLFAFCALLHVAAPAVHDESPRVCVQQDLAAP